MGIYLEAHFPGIEQFSFLFPGFFTHLFKRLLGVFLLLSCLMDVHTKKIALFFPIVIGRVCLRDVVSGNLYLKLVCLLLTPIKGLAVI